MELVGPAWDCGTNFSGAFTARPDLRLLVDATGELIASFIEMSASGFRVVIDTSIATKRLVSRRKVLVVWRVEGDVGGNKLV